MMAIQLNALVLMTTLLFVIGMFGVVLNRKNILIIIVSIELMLLAVNLNFVIFSVYLDDVLGQLFVLFILTVAAAESAIGLAILIAYYKIKGTILTEKIGNLKV